MATKELSFPGTVKNGDRGNAVKLAQEWLCLHGLHLRIDGSFGPATEYAVRQFQEQEDLPAHGRVDQATFDALVLPMKEALEPISNGSKGLGKLIVQYASQHLKSSPREVGGQNQGPWVRLYMNGREGAQWPWCAGFACFVLRQACESADLAPPIPGSFSCDVLATTAKGCGLLLSETARADNGDLKPGCFFLNKRTSSDWDHTGVVTGVEEETFLTIEGNTNDDGSREGYEVCARVRGYRGKDFILLG
jgi:hypothetical protein